MNLDFVKPLIPFIPEVKGPAKPPTVKEKFIWTGIIILIFFVMYHVYPFGVEPKITGGASDFLQIVLASKMGSLLTIGIGPIVLSSIILQLFVGAKLIKIDLKNPEDKMTFTATQKTLTVLIAFAEAALFVLPGVYLAPSSTLVDIGVNSGFLDANGMTGLLIFLAILQIAGASILLLFMDEVTSKHGLGSGISIFIAAGVSLAIIQGSLFLILGGRGVSPDITVMQILAKGGATAIPDAIVALLPHFFTLLVILVCIYAEGMKVEIPLTVDRIRVRSMYPLKLLYVSVLPVILTSALLMNVQILARPMFLDANWQIDGQPIEINGHNLAHYIAVVDSNGYIVDGALVFLTSFVNPLYLGYPAYISMLQTPTPEFGIPQIVHVLVYMILYVLMCVFFGKFWIEAAGMDAGTIAGQITQSGLSRPGFRTDPRILEGMLERYITTVAVIGSVFVGLLAVLADVTGAIGTGTGILLTVGIMYKFHEDFKQKKIFESYPRLNDFFGGSS